MGDIKTQVGVLEGRIQSKQLEEFDNNFKRAEEGLEKWLSSSNHVLSHMELSTVYKTSSEDPLPSSESHEH